MAKKATVELFSINPKCVTLGELYGEVDQNTMEWSDGLLASAIRVFAKHNDKSEMKELVSATPETTRSSSRTDSPMSKTTNEPDVDSVCKYLCFLSHHSFVYSFGDFTELLPVQMY